MSQDYFQFIFTRHSLISCTEVCIKTRKKYCFFNPTSFASEIACDSYKNSGVEEENAVLYTVWFGKIKFQKKVPVGRKSVDPSFVRVLSSFCDTQSVKVCSAGAWVNVDMFRTALVDRKVQACLWFRPGFAVWVLSWGRAPEDFVECNPRGRPCAPTTTRSPPRPLCAGWSCSPPP